MLGWDGKPLEASIENQNDLDNNEYVRATSATNITSGTGIWASQSEQVLTLGPETAKIADPKEDGWWAYKGAIWATYGEMKAIWVDDQLVGYATIRDRFGARYNEQRPEPVKQEGVRKAMKLVGMKGEVEIIRGQWAILPSSLDALADQEAARAAKGDQTRLSHLKGQGNDDS